MQTASNLKVRRSKKRLVPWEDGFLRLFVVVVVVVKDVVKLKDSCIKITAIMWSCTIFFFN